MVSFGNVENGLRCMNLDFEGSNSFQVVLKKTFILKLKGVKGR